MQESRSSLAHAARSVIQERDAVRYQHRLPEQTLFYRIIEQHYPVLFAYLAEQGRGLPEYAQRKFEDYLKCGRLEYGFLWLHCDTYHSLYYYCSMFVQEGLYVGQNSM